MYQVYALLVRDLESSLSHKSASWVKRPIEWRKHTTCSLVLPFSVIVLLELWKFVFQRIRFDNHFNQVRCPQLCSEGRGRSVWAPWHNGWSSCVTPLHELVNYWPDDRWSGHQDLTRLVGRQLENILLSLLEGNRNGQEAGNNGALTLSWSNLRTRRRLELWGRADWVGSRPWPQLLEGVTPSSSSFHLNEFEGELY